jgi:thiol-disulfide isomerase/thioredoxin
MKILEAAVGFLLVSFSVGADMPALMVGHPAPKLQASKWVQGAPVKEFERDKAYVVEFWATWCGPCVVAIPHLNDLHNKFKDKGLVVIGQDVWENDTAAVEPFVKKMGEQMSYRVALDTPEEGSRGKMADTWMKAAGRTGIPSSFVVDKRGLIAWIGHPMELKEPLLQKVLNGSFDVARAGAEYEQKLKREKAEEPLWEEFNRRMKSKEWDEADAALTKLENARPENERSDLAVRRFNLLMDRKDYARAYKLAAQLSDAHPDDVAIQGALASRMYAPGASERDLDLAEKIARRANEAGKGTDPGMLTILAQVLFLKGEKDAAIEYQTKAVELLAEGPRRRSLQQTLDRYKKADKPKTE